MFILLLAMCVVHGLSISKAAAFQTDVPLHKEDVAGEQAAARETDLSKQAAHLTIRSDFLGQHEMQSAAAPDTPEPSGVQQFVDSVIQWFRDFWVGDADRASLQSYVSTAVIDRRHNLIMGWSARSACTSAMTMFFENGGIYTLENMFEFPKVHDYREALGDAIMPRLTDMTNPQFIKFKIVRNPYKRAISTWIHQMATNFSKDLGIQRLTAAHWKHGGNLQNASFLDWLRLVKRIGIDEFDFHTRPQISNWEKNGGKYDVILKLEAPDFKKMLERINARSNSTLKLGTLHVSTVSFPQFVQKKASELYASAEAVDLVKQIYRDDFAAYGYSYDLPSDFDSMQTS